MTLMDGTLALNGLDYHEKCIMGGPDMRMPRGDGTVKMLRVSLAFMMNKFAASIQTITLSDASHVPCRFADGDVRSVSLMNSYIAVHGQTWYESKFGAVLFNPVEREQYDKRILKLNALEKNGIKFEQLNVELATTDVATVAKIQSIFDRSATLNAFFKGLREEFKDAFCMITQKWLDIFISIIILERCTNPGSTWLIPTTKVSRVTFTIEQTDVFPPDDVSENAGGGGLSRKFGESTTMATYGWEL